MNPLVLSFLCAVAALGLIAYSVLGRENALFAWGRRRENSLPQPIAPAVNDIIAQKLEEQIGALEAEIQALKENLANKERELEKEHSASLELKMQFEEKMNKLAAQEKKAGELTGKISGLEAQVNEYKIALKSQANTLEALKAVPPQAAAVAEGISLQEYNRLKEKLEQAEEVLRILHAADK